MKEKKHVLVVNQHGENRGDESALRAMLDGVTRRLDGNVKFTIIVQFQDTSLTLPFQQEVEQLHMKMPIPQFILMVVYSLLLIVKINVPFLLSKETQKIIAAYRSCDIVVSAPGGPYFGDIYANHEIVHWYYVWLGKLFKKSLFLYATSAGPFNIKVLNLIRKYFFRKFDTICVREEISKGFLQQLLGPNQEIIVTADSAIQTVVTPLDRGEFFSGKKGYTKDKIVIAVSAIEYKFPGEDDASLKQEKYTRTLMECLNHLTELQNCYFLFIPQLYGGVHSDMGYLGMLTESLPENTTWEIVNQEYNSDKQRAIFAMCDLCIASRYHPQIFAGSSGVPGICIYYEHKAIGFMKFLGLEEFAFDIRNLDVVKMKAGLDKAITDKEILQKQMEEKIVPVRDRASLTSELLVNYLVN